MLHRAFAAVERAAQGIDDALATRAAEAAFVHRERVVAAAGDLWES
ncbi:MAG: hypothetical protein ACXWNK_04420 [Vulcanimicrobiaceae bacterium]